MAEQESLPQSLSEEESELLLPPSGKAKKVKGVSLSPSRKSATATTDQGYKFSPPDSPNFDFASQSKNSNGTTTNSTSSSEGEDTEGFVHVDPASVAEGELNGGGKTPTTPSKLPTPHKRTAEVTGPGDETAPGQNGSPPSSPAPKKRKAWEDFVAEDNLKRQKQKDGGEGAGEGGWSLKWVVVVVTLLLIPAAALIFGKTPVQEEMAVKEPAGYSWKQAHDAFFRDLSKMKKKFGKQNKETWIQLVASITSTLQETEPEHPAAITILLPPSMSPQFSTCFLEKLAITVNSAVAPILQHLNDSTHFLIPAPKHLSPATFSGDQTVTQIRADLDSYFSSKGKAVIVQNVDKMASEGDLLLFHGLCDNFLAVDKRATILFPVQVPENIYQKYAWSHARGGDISQDVLNEAFSKVVSADTGPALVARITDAVILLNEGDKCTQK